MILVKHPITQISVMLHTHWVCDMQQLLIYRCPSLLTYWVSLPREIYLPSLLVISLHFCFVAAISRHLGTENLFELLHTSLSLWQRWYSFYHSGFLGGNTFIGGVVAIGPIRQSEEQSDWFNRNLILDFSLLHNIWGKKRRSRIGDRRVGASWRPDTWEEHHCDLFSVITGPAPDILLLPAVIGPVAFLGILFGCPI